MNYPEKLATLGTQDTGRRQTEQTHHYTQTNTNNVNKIWDLLKYISQRII